MARYIRQVSMEDFRKILKSHGLRATQQRIVVHAAMLELGHASADMVCEYVSAHCESGATVASVYNILSQMAEIGVYRRRLSANNKMYFDVNSGGHAHLYDMVNNEYKDIADDEIVETIEKHFKGRRFKGYKVDTIDIQLNCHPTRRRGPRKVEATTTPETK